MANSTLKNFSLYILDTRVLLEIEVSWHMSESNELTIDDFYGYHFDTKTGEYERIPYWLHKIIETTGELDEYHEQIDANCDESTY